MKYYSYLLLVVLALFSSCRDDFKFEPNSGNLRFSKTTVYLDTVFTNIGSSTYNLKVYNTTDKNISIPTIQLSKGASSKYRLMVDGIPGKSFENIEILAKDSMYVFIEITANTLDANPTDFLYTDEIEFGVGPSVQKVNLVTLIQDAIFLYPQRFTDGTTETLPIGGDSVYGFFLDESDPVNGNELHWTNTKPYVVYGYAAVPSTKTLVIDAGARVYFHAESGIIVANNASLHVEGLPSSTTALENEVIFEGDRLETAFSEVPGQWGIVWLTQGSTDNIINHLTIKNATVGLFVTGNDGSGLPTLAINNTQIYNCANLGLLARTGNITAQNMVINNSGQASLGCSFGGVYDFTHCTFANYWPSTTQTCVILDDANGDALFNLSQANFNNCLIYGSSNFGINLKKNEASTLFNYQFNNCLIKFADFSSQFTTDPLYQFSGLRYTNSIIATNSTNNKPDFKNTSKNQFEIGQNSAAKGTANFTFSTFPDIMNQSRTNPSDIGAYNNSVF